MSDQKVRLPVGTIVKVDAMPDCELHPFLLPAEPIPLADVDGRTHRGPWAFMCAACWDVAGVGLGTGRGQRLVLRVQS